MMRGDEDRRVERREEEEGRGSGRRGCAEVRESFLHRNNEGVKEGSAVRETEKQFGLPR